MRTLSFTIITCSDTRTIDEDSAGKRLAELIAEQNWELTNHIVVKDELQLIANAIKEAAEKEVDVILTCGGTGLSPRDVTPEATRMVCDREVPGIAEAIRAYSLTKTRRAMLSRACAAQLKRSLIINFPGSLKAAQENWEAVYDQLEHAVLMSEGGGH